MSGKPSAKARYSSGDIVLPVAPALRSNEKVFSLREEDWLTDDGKELHRYQIITVERDDRLVEFTRDMGKSEDYTDIGDFLILSLFEDEVASVMDDADNMREANQIKPFLDELRDESTLIEDAVRYQEQKRLAALGKTTMGATGKLHQRNK